MHTLPCKDTHCVYITCLTGSKNSYQVDHDDEEEAHLTRELAADYPPCKMHTVYICYIYAIPGVCMYIYSAHFQPRARNK